MQEPLQKPCTLFPKNMAIDARLPNLFSDIMPFGGKLDESNSWIKFSELIPWKKLIALHDSYFNNKRLQTVKDGRLILGLTLGKFRTGLSDRGILDYFYENPYFQYFCGLDQFASKSMKLVHNSLLSKRRKQLGAAYFQKFEEEILEILKSHKLAKGKKCCLLDATVFCSNITYPNDVKLLNTVRSWSCDKISELKKLLNLSTPIRTYKRKAKQVYLNFAKKKKKSKKLIRNSRRKMLQFTRRNISQLENLLKNVQKKISTQNFKLSFIQEADLNSLYKQIKQKLVTAKEIYSQQSEMHKEKKNKIQDRIVSFEQPWVRPIIRGKEGRSVEFGAKAHISSTDGFAMIDKVEHRAFSEKLELKDSLKQHHTRFDCHPKKVLIDDAYSSHDNKALLKKCGIEHSLKFAGRQTDKKKIYLKRKMRRERSKIEGVIGNLKKDYGMKLVTLKIKEGAEIQARIAASLFNINRAIKMI